MHSYRFNTKYACYASYFIFQCQHSHSRNFLKLGFFTFIAIETQILLKQNVLTLLIFHKLKVKQTPAMHLRDLPKPFTKIPRFGKERVLMLCAEYN
jgi:hypothetical protein